MGKTLWEILANMSALLAHPYVLVAVSIFCGFLADFVLLGSVPFICFHFTCHFPDRCGVEFSGGSLDF